MHESETGTGLDRTSSEIVSFERMSSSTWPPVAALRAANKEQCRSL